ncbi:AAA family ATPase [Bradyrhizobium sp. USDA 4502]
MLISNISKLAHAGVLADRNAKSPSIEFKRFNLIYGFNGSGKSTLSRCFAAMQDDPPPTRLPAGCEFEVLTSDGTTIKAGPGNGLAGPLAVFNEDFINLNLQWSAGRAKPVFYIGREQAELAAELAKTEAALPAANERKIAAERLHRTKEQQLTAFKRDSARAISAELRQASRKYEAPQLTSDYANLDLGADAKLDDQGLAAQREVCRLEQAMPKVDLFGFGTSATDDALKKAATLLLQTPSLTIIAELQKHPEMLLWVQEGSSYHREHRLESCLFCGGELSDERKQLLERALDEGFQQFVAQLENVRDVLGKERDRYLKAALNLAPSKEIAADVRGTYEDAAIRVKDSLQEAVETVLSPAIAAIEAKLQRPTIALKEELAWNDEKLIASALGLVNAWADVLNSAIEKHNESSAKFTQRQDEARLALRRHHLADKKSEFQNVSQAISDAQADVDTTTASYNQLQQQAIDLRSRIKEHGRAAEKINRLIEAYLGHNELSISSVEEGYEIHRRGRPIDSSPSEGEKTAIAICYFLSTLEAEGRSIKDRIVIVDDPISSLDSRALNYACSLLLSRLANAAQVFVLTHNQNCMNEFKKAWKGLHKPRNEATAPTASLLFLDVKIPKGTGARSSSIVEMSKLLREYDSEYHYLVDHVLKFDASTDTDYEYGYMMPNVLRRVLDVFLAFRCPGSAGFASKMGQLRRDNATLDDERIAALERLVQLESHSDSIDDLIGFSSMTLEESKAATAAMVAMMEAVDPTHLAGLRRLCR